MKTKSLFILTATSLLFAGCAKNEIMEQNPDAKRAIGFGVYTGVQTRGLVTDNSDTDGSTVNGLKVAGKGFGIQAYLTQADYATSLSPKAQFMDNQQVTWNAAPAPGTWTYSPVKFWPASTTEKISFFAYAPYSSTGGTHGITLTHATPTADPILNFALQTNQKDMVDLVVSEAKTGNNGTINQTKSTSTTAVGFNFKHVLSRVAMKAKTDADLTATGNLTKVFITAVSIEHTNKLNSKADFNMYSHSWQPSADYLAASYTLNDYASNGILDFKSQTFGNYTKTAAIDISTNKDGVALFPSNEYLFLIPVNGATGTASEGDVSVKITYDIVSKASTASAEISSTTDTKTAKLPASTLAQGSAYVYTFTIGLNEIKVDVTAVDGWTDTAQNATVQ